ncbi:EthD domain-containing protein [Sphingobium sufflavum]|uniref:EthD domain-containing protein n=1 Tax=Sphingobium sufflavum TaxID=1129547 RepID=UPI001F4916EB|nr:EthD domain-containing protein [Sphingobium sufflavum]MCE7798315.1 EthD domain-containing protein [Sphingobium sufflavum]
MTEKTIYKILLFMARKPGLSVEAFRDYYETHHAPLAMRYSSGITRYIRRYIDRQPHPETGPGDDIPYDVITELWFEDERIFSGSLDYMKTNIMPDDIIADELNLFDRASFRMATVVERESDMSQAGRPGP